VRILVWDISTVEVELLVDMEEMIYCTMNNGLYGCNAEFNGTEMQAKKAGWYIWHQTRPGPFYSSIAWCHACYKIRVGGGMIENERLSKDQQGPINL